jgi:short-subunit dehydrogenase
MAVPKILITGASSGLGAALASVYAAPGVTLLLWGRDASRLDGVARTCREKGAAVLTEAFDLRDITGMVARLSASDAAQPINLAIFCAGLGGLVPPDQLGEPPDMAQAMAEVDFVSPSVGASFISGTMAKRGHGHIVLVGSIAESFPLPMAPIYAGSKAGLAMFAEALAGRMVPHGVAVTLVSPGYVDTPMSQSLGRPRPFLLTADRAAQIITRKLTKRPLRIVVPWQFIFIRAFAMLLPRALLRAILRRA